MQEQINMIMNTLEIMNDNFKLMDHLIDRLTNRVMTLEDSVCDMMNHLDMPFGDKK